MVALVALLVALVALPSDRLTGAEISRRVHEGMITNDHLVALDALVALVALPSGSFAWLRWLRQLRRNWDPTLCTFSILNCLP